MTIEFQQLDGQPRLLMEAELEPIQGTRFQPTGFPDLGAAVYDAPDANGGSTQMILVESAQSVANRLEDVCWDEGTDSPHSALAGMPYVDVTLWDSGDRTNSLQEAHRLNSPYIMRDDDFKEKLRTDAKLPVRDTGAGGTEQGYPCQGGVQVRSGVYTSRGISGEDSRTRSPATLHIGVHRS